MKYCIYIVVGLLWGFLSACLRLDSQLYNTQKISAYVLDGYTGAQDFTLDSSYKIPQDKIMLFTLKSQMSGEAKASTLYAVYVGDTARISSDTVILYCHGNKWHMDFYWQRAKLLANVGGKNHYGVLMLDYRGYGMSEGKSTEASLYEDVDVAMQWLQGMGLKNERLVIYGFSLGSFPSCELGAYPHSMRPMKVILEAPYANSAAMVADASGIALPASYVTSLKIDNANKAKNMSQPMLWLHGSDDHYCQLETQGQVVFDNYKGPKSKIIVPGADHENIPVSLGFTTYIQSLDAFVKKPQ